MTLEIGSAAPLAADASHPPDDGEVTQGGAAGRGVARAGRSMRTTKTRYCRRCYSRIVPLAEIRDDLAAAEQTAKDLAARHDTDTAYATRTGALQAICKIAAERLACHTRTCKRAGEKGSAAVEVSAALGVSNAVAWFAWGPQSLVTFAIVAVIILATVGLGRAMRADDEKIAEARALRVRTRGDR
jgi:hypothetical protein